MIKQVLIGFALLGASMGEAATVTYDGPLADKWYYSNADGGQIPYGGANGSAAIFAFLNTDDDDRLGGMLVTFGTSADIPTGRSASEYAISSVRLTLTLSSNNS